MTDAAPHAGLKNVPVRWRSSRTVLGMPLYDIVLRPGVEPGWRRAHGLVAVGAHASGVFAFGGGTARGVVALAGGAAVGVFAYAGGASAGLVAVSGGLSLGILALAGGFSIGALVGSGGFTFGLKTYTKDPSLQNSLGVEWLDEALSHWWIAIVVCLPLVIAIVARLRTGRLARRENA